MKKKFLAQGLSLMLILIGFLFPALPLAQTTERISVGLEGEDANGYSSTSALSAEGRFVAFTSRASNLVAGDDNGAADIFVYDRQTGTTERVSVGLEEENANDRSYTPALSADGRYVAFWSFASNLVPEDTNEEPDVFVYDRQTGTTERVSIGLEGEEANGDSGGPSLSADGRHVAFWSEASNLVPGDTNGYRDIFIYDRQTGTTERVSVGLEGAEANRLSTLPALSADGGSVAFQSTSVELGCQ